MNFLHDIVSQEFMRRALVGQHELVEGLLVAIDNHCHCILHRFDLQVR